MAMLPSRQPSSGLRDHARRLIPEPDIQFDNSAFAAGHAGSILREAASDTDRRALARRLHDDLGQTMFALRMEVDHLSELYTKHASESVVQKSIEAVRGSMGDALKVVRTLCAELRDTGDSLLELAPHIESTVHALAHRGNLTSRVMTVGGRVQIEGRRALLVNEVCREAVMNVLRHARASTVTVRIMRRGVYFSVSVRDDGRGFHPEALERRDAFGVMGMRERAQVLGGSLRIVREDDHTVVALSAPLRATSGSPSEVSA